jgi:hypothetical protein
MSRRRQSLPHGVPSGPGSVKSACRAARVSKRLDLSAQDISSRLVSGTQTTVRPQSVDRTRGPIQLAREDHPTRPHPAKSPLASFERSPAGRRNELIGWLTQCGTDPIHRLGDLSSRVTCDILPDCVAEQLTPGLPGPARKLLGAVKYVVGNGYHSLHTINITGPRCAAGIVRSGLAGKRRATVREIPRHGGTGPLSSI